MTRQHAGVIFGGILFLVIAMGISRFAFTPILPFMRIDEGFTLEVAGWLASSNYIGYFVGALGAGFILKNKKNFLLVNVLINVTSIILMGLTHTFALWILLRFIGDDWKGNERWLKTEEDLNAVSVDVIYLHHTAGVSSTMLREKKQDKIAD